MGVPLDCSGYFRELSEEVGGTVHGAEVQSERVLAIQVGQIGTR